MDDVDVRSLLDGDERTASDWAFKLTPDAPNLAANIERLGAVIVDGGMPFIRRRNALTAVLNLTRVVVQAAPLAVAFERLRMSIEMTIDEEDSEVSGRAQMALKTLDHRLHGNVASHKKIHR